MQYVIVLLLDPNYGIFDNLPINMFTENPHFMKAAATKDPDTPTLKEVMMDFKHRDKFIKAMDVEIKELESHNTWTVMRKADMPEGANLLPSTWAFKIKRNPDGSIRKYKARFCVRGDKQIADVDYFESYAPVVSWSTVRMLLNLSIQKGWYTRQVDFSNAFVQADIEEEVYVTLPALFKDDSQEEDMVLKLNKTLYGLVQAPRAWYYHLLDSFTALGFEPSVNEPGVFTGHGIIVVCWVDDCLFFGPDKDKIDEVIQKLQDMGYTLTEEDSEKDVFTFLGVTINRYGEDIVLSQHNLIKKVLETTGYTDMNPRKTPATMDPLGTNANGKTFTEKWHYASVIGMLMYL